MHLWRLAGLTVKFAVILTVFTVMLLWGDTLLTSQQVSEVPEPDRVVDSTGFHVLGLDIRQVLLAYLLGL
jgi:hypothetical protein